MINIIINTFASSFDGSNFTNLGIQSKYGHSSAYLSKYEGRPFIVGGKDYEHYLKWHAKTETLVDAGTANQAWTEMADYPFASA